VWITKPFTNWKKGIEKIKAHVNSDTCIKANQTALAHLGTQHTGTIIQQLQNETEQERMLSKETIKSFFCCAYFLAYQHIPHTTNIDKLVELVVSCGGEGLKKFLDKTGRNAMYTSHVAVVEFIEALGKWVEESLIKCLRQASYFSIMADECTDVVTIEEMSVYCRWQEDGVPEEHFLEIRSPLEKS